MPHDFFKTGQGLSSSLRNYRCSVTTIQPDPAYKVASSPLTSKWNCGLVMKQVLITYHLTESHIINLSQTFAGHPKLQQTTQLKENLVVTYKGY